MTVGVRASTVPQFKHGCVCVWVWVWVAGLGREGSIPQQEILGTSVG